MYFLNIKCQSYILLRLSNQVYIKIINLLHKLYKGIAPNFIKKIKFYKGTYSYKYFIVKRLQQQKSAKSGNSVKQNL